MVKILHQQIYKLKWSIYLKTKRLELVFVKQIYFIKLKRKTLFFLIQMNHKCRVQSTEKKRGNLNM